MVLQELRWKQIIKTTKRIKSIKEKAIEYTKDYLFSPVPQRAPNIHFEEGANYVLDVIEEFMKHNLVYGGNLERLIEQLKK